MSESIFKSKWFSDFALRAISGAIHNNKEDAIALEGQLMSEFAIQLLNMQKEGTLFNEGLYNFYSFCQSRLFLSHSQILQDLWVLYMLKEKENGFFVEFGACNGISMSNTLLLEERYNWNGILAEPNPLWHEELFSRRKSRISTKCVSAKSGEIADFLSTPKMPELSRMKNVIPDDVHEKNGNRSLTEQIEVATISLNDLLMEHDAPNFIDYLSIDTEGSELEILESFDFSKFTVNLITVEHAGEISKRAKIKELLESKGFFRWRPEITRWDDWYINKNNL